MLLRVQDNGFLQEFSTAKLSEKCTISRLKTAITSIFSSTVSVPVEPVPRLSLYCTTWYHPEAGTAPPALLGARTGRNPDIDEKCVMLWKIFIVIINSKSLTRSSPDETLTGLHRVTAFHSRTFNYNRYSRRNAKYLKDIVENPCEKSWIFKSDKLGE